MGRTVVIVEPVKFLRDSMYRIVRSELSERGVEPVAFADYEAASQFARECKETIAGYIHEISFANLLSGPSAGLRFYTLVAETLTPGVKSVFLCDDLPMEVMTVFVRAATRIRVMPRMEQGWEGQLRQSAHWLLQPVTQDQGSQTEAKHAATIQLLVPTWEEICDYIASSPRNLDSVDPRHFELLVAEIFRSHGWDVDLTSRTVDGGYDVIAVRRAAPTDLRVLVEAKRWAPDRPVGVGVVRSLYGVRAANSASQVVLATSSYVTAAAKQEFAKVVPWELDFLERQRILDWCISHGAVELGGTLSAPLRERLS